MTTSIVEYSKTEAALAELRTKYNRKYDVTNTAGMTDAKKARAEIRTYRTDLEKMRKEIKAPALERCRLIDAEAARITSELEALEGPIDDAIKVEEARKEAEKQAAERAAKALSDAALQLANEMRAALTAMVGRPAAEVADQLKAMRTVKVPDNVHANDVSAVKDQVVAQLEVLHARAVSLEAEDKRRAAERAELEALRAQAAKEEEARQAREKESAARLAAQANAEKEKLEAAAKAERERIEADRRKAEQERTAADAKAAAERQAADAAAQKARDAANAEAAKRIAEQERVAREAREKEEARLRAERAKLDAERDAAAALERQKKEAAEAKAKADKEVAEAKARAAENKRIKSLTARGMLAEFVSLYGAEPEFKEIAATLEAFLASTAPATTTPAKAKKAAAQ